MNDNGIMSLSILCCAPGVFRGLEHREKKYDVNNNNTKNCTEINKVLRVILIKAGTICLTAGQRVYREINVGFDNAINA